MLTLGPSQILVTVKRLLLPNDLATDLQNTRVLDALLQLYQLKWLLYVYVPLALTQKNSLILLTEYICLYRVVLKINCDYFPEQY